MRKVRTVLAMAIGAGAAYFGDPAQGRRRRTQAADQLRAWSRRRRREAARQARYEEGRTTGEAARARGAGHYHPHGDADLQEHLRMVLANHPVATSLVNVEVYEGLARLRGQVENASEAAALVEAVRQVPGVGGVEDLLHLPGEVPPNKAAAVAASAAASAPAATRTSPAPAAVHAGPPTSTTGPPATPAPLDEAAAADWSAHGESRGPHRPGP